MKNYLFIILILIFVGSLFAGKMLIGGKMGDATVAVDVNDTETAVTPEYVFSVFEEVYKEYDKYDFFHDYYEATTKVLVKEYYKVLEEAGGDPEAALIILEAQYKLTRKKLDRILFLGATELKKKDEAESSTDGVRDEEVGSRVVISPNTDPDVQNKIDGSANIMDPSEGRTDLDSAGGLAHQSNSNEGVAFGRRANLSELLDVAGEREQASRDADERRIDWASFRSLPPTLEEQEATSRREASILFGKGLMGLNDVAETGPVVTPETQITAGQSPLVDVIAEIGVDFAARIPSKVLSSVTSAVAPPPGQVTGQATLRVGVGATIEVGNSLFLKFTIPDPDPEALGRDATGALKRITNAEPVGPAMIPLRSANDPRSDGILVEQTINFR